MANELSRILCECDAVARTHCGMPVDLERIVADRAYRDAVYRVLAASRHPEAQTVAAKRERLEATIREACRAERVETG